MLKINAVIKMIFVAKVIMKSSFDSCSFRNVYLSEIYIFFVRFYAYKDLIQRLSPQNTVIWQLLFSFSSEPSLYMDGTPGLATA